ncbi:MAG: toxic anion resistance protein, partial [Bulleidia sp.]
MSETQAQEQKITLTLTPEEVKEEQQTQLQNLEEEKQEEPKKGKTLEEMYQDAHLSDAERKTVEDFSEKINIRDTNTILEYGSAAQKKVQDFSDSALKNVRTKDLGEIGDLMTTLVQELKSTAPDEEKNKGFFGGLFKKSGDKVS